MSGRRIAALGDIPEGEGLLIDRDLSQTDDDLALFLVDGTVYALDNTCSHEEASLADGFVEEADCSVECPLHAAQFDLRTGAALCLPATRPVATHQVEVRGDDVYLR